MLLSDRYIYHILGAELTLGQAVTTRTKLGFLALLAGMFDLIWIGASLAVVYFLYGALANDLPWAYLGWLFTVGFLAKLIAVALKDNKQRVDYVDQLMKRGYKQGEAAAAWRTAKNGGLNLLRNLQQAELGVQIKRLERSINTPGTGGNSE